MRLGFWSQGLHNLGVSVFRSFRLEHEGRALMFCTAGIMGLGSVQWRIKARGLVL